MVEITTTNSLSSQDISVISVLPDDYRKLTTANFFISNAKVNWCGGQKHYDNNIIDSYNATTGVLHCNPSTSYGGQFTIYVTYTIVAIY